MIQTVNMYKLYVLYCIILTDNNIEFMEVLHYQEMVLFFLFVLESANEV